MTGRRSGHVHTRNRHEIVEHATDRHQNLAPKSGLCVISLNSLALR